jgi:hypothetical protein
MAVAITQDEQTKTPFYLTEQNQTTPDGHFFIDDGTLVLEFLGERPAIRVAQPQSGKLIDFVTDSSFSVTLPDDEDLEVRVYLPSDGSGRYVVYGIREWTGIDGMGEHAVRKQAFLTKFDSAGAKIVAIWQLALPYVLFGSAFILHAFFSRESLPDLAYFVDVWQGLALSPVVAVHYVLLLIPGIALLFCNRMWALRAMFNATSLLALIAILYCLVQPSWLPLPPTETPLVLQQYWTVFLPYLLFLMIPAYYYVAVERRQ